MNRPIKFRAWDKEKNRVLEVFQIDIKHDCVLCYLPLIDKGPAVWLKTGKYELMQFTGLKDKNGEEIYERDVIRILYTDWPSQPYAREEYQKMSLDEYKKSISKVGEVVYAGGQFSIDFHDGYGTGTLFEGTHGEKEVIGNIYENPELLTTKDS